MSELEAVKKVFLKNSIFFWIGWFVFIVSFLGLNYLYFPYTSGIKKFSHFLNYLGWGIIGWPKIWLLIKGGGLKGALSPSYEVVTTYGDGRVESDGGAQSATTNLFVKLIQIGFLYVIGGIVQIIHLFILSIKSIVLHVKASPKPAFAQSGLFIIVLNIAVFIGAIVVGGTIQNISDAAFSAERGEKTSGDYQYVQNETKDGIILEQYLSTKGDIIIPATIDGLPVVGLNDRNFNKSKARITSVVFPDTVTFIDGGFRGCTELTQITLPKNLKFIGGNTFMNTGITSITIPEGVTDIGGWAFRDCKNLTSVTFPRSLQRVGESAFRDCTSLVDVIIPSGHTVQYGSGSYSSGSFVADQDYVGTVTAGRKSHFLGCSSLSAASQQAIRDSGYIGEF